MRYYYFITQCWFVYSKYVLKNFVQTLVYCWIYDLRPIHGKLRHCSYAIQLNLLIVFSLCYGQINNPYLFENHLKNKNTFFLHVIVNTFMHQWVKKTKQNKDPKSLAMLALAFPCVLWDGVWIEKSSLRSGTHSYCCCLWPATFLWDSWWFWWCWWGRRSWRAGRSYGPL